MYVVHDDDGGLGDARVFAAPHEPRDADATFALQIERLGQRDDCDVVPAVDVGQVVERGVIEVPDCAEEPPISRLR